MLSPTKQILSTTLSLLCCLAFFIALTSQAQAADEIARARKELLDTPEDMSLLKILKKRVGATTDPYEQSELTIIYYFGCLYSGETKEMRKVLYYLKKNHPDSEHLKYLTSQYTHNTCTVCEGVGRNKRTCNPCKGTGVCSACKKADAKVRNSIADGTLRVKCTECKATTKCKLCEGSGKEMWPCLTCKSTGQVYSRDRVAMTYIALLSGNRQVLKELGR